MPSSSIRFITMIFFCQICYFPLAAGQEKKGYVIREVCSIGVPSSTVSAEWQNGSLTFDGEQLIVVDPYKKLSLYSVKDLSERIVYSSPLLLAAWSDSVTGGVFVRMKENATIGRKGPVKAYDLLYFEDTDRLVNWTPKWSIGIAEDQMNGHDGIAIQWISGSQLFAIYDPCLRPTVLFVNLSGNVIGEIKVPGPILGGIDTCDEGLELFFLSRDTREVSVMRGVVDAKYEKLRTIGKFANAYPYHFMTGGTREIRLRGLKQGDVRKFVELTSQPTYWQRNDMLTLGLTPAQLDAMKYTFSGYKTLAKLSFAESPTNYEISPVGMAPRRHADPSIPFLGHPILYRRSDGYILLPQQTLVIDAVLSDVSWVISLKTSTQKRGSRPFDSYSLCTLPQSP